MNNRFWRTQSFRWVLFSVVQFLVLSSLAMLVYPGGTGADKSATGYSFFSNFFSDLGLTSAHNGRVNTLSMPLFMIALTGAGLGLVLFFVSFTQFFRHTLASRLLSWAGTALGIGAGACFVGVAFTPADVFRQLHGTFVLYAFGLFFLATTIYCIAMVIDRGYPSRYSLIFFVFALMLGAVHVAVTQGPRGSSDSISIQATGQKLIVYAALISIGAQSAAALAVGARRGASAPTTAAMQA